MGRSFFNAYDRLFAFRTHLEIREDVKAVRILTDNMISHLQMETDTTIWTFHLLSQIAQVVENILFDGKPVEKEHSNDML